MQPLSNLRYPMPKFKPQVLQNVVGGGSWKHSRKGSRNDFGRNPDPLNEHEHSDVLNSEYNSG